MARVFTTTFQYNGHTYTALVTEQKKSLTITMVDGTLQLVLPLGEHPAAPERDPGTQVSNLQEVRSLVGATLLAVEAARARQQRDPSSLNGTPDRGLANG